MLEWLDVVSRLLTEGTVTHDGPLYHLDGAVLEPKPSRLPPVYMGGGLPKAKEVIAAQADASVMHGDAPEDIAAKVSDLNARRDAAGRPPVVFGVSGYVILPGHRDGGPRRTGPDPRRPVLTGGLRLL